MTTTASNLREKQRVRTLSLADVLPGANDNALRTGLAPLAPTPTLPGARSVLKMAMDRLGALVGLIMLAPVLLVLAYLVKRDGGPAFYGQQRVGQNGRKFKCWKFRSMVPNAADVLNELLARDPEARAEWERDFKLKNDPRVTRLGALLRKTSLDELPQLWNVLVGEMSLVGVRPVTEAELKNYGDKLGDYYAMLPGMTGLWQVSGRNDVTYAERVQMDSDYVRGWSLLGDIRIIFQTIGVMLQKRGAY